MKTLTIYQQKKLLEVVLYVLRKTEGIDYYRLFKILYFADRDHLATWGTPVIDDDFCALQWGPVPTRLYNLVKGKDISEPLLSKLFGQNIHSASEDATNVLLGKRDANKDYLSKSNIAALDSAIDQYACLTFNQLVKKSHDSAYNNAWKGTGRKLISPTDIAIAGGANQAMVDYITDQTAVDAALL